MTTEEVLEEIKQKEEGRVKAAEEKIESLMAELDELRRSRDSDTITFKSKYKAMEALAEQEKQARIQLEAQCAGENGICLSLFADLVRQAAEKDRILRQTADDLAKANRENHHFRELLDRKRKLEEEQERR